MKKLSTLLAIIMCFAQQSQANACEDNEKDQSSKKLSSSFKNLFNAGAVQQTQGEQFFLHPDFVKELKKSGVVEEMNAKDSVICTGPY